MEVLGRRSVAPKILNKCMILVLRIEADILENKKQKQTNKQKNLVIDFAYETPRALIVGKYTIFYIIHILLRTISYAVFY